jgi:CRISPR-associated protein Csb2
MLVLGIRYLTGFAAATEPDSHERAEWPPHPGRVFMALAAAYFQTEPGVAIRDANDRWREEREALLWLQSLDEAPAIRAGGYEERARVTHYVPINDKPGPAKTLLQSIPLTRDRQPRTFARAFLEDDIVYMLWHSAAPTEVVRAALARLCGKVTRIGHSSSLVQMWLADDDPGSPSWIPDDERAIIRLRIVGPGTLEDLERRYNGHAAKTFGDLQVATADDSDKKAQRAAKARLKAEFGDGPPSQQRPRLALYRGYARPVEASERLGGRGTVFDPFFTVLTLGVAAGPCRHLDLAYVLSVTSRFRDAIISHSNDLPPSIRSMLSGHELNGAPLAAPHLAFVPLGFVDHPHADGHLLGLGVTLPTSLSRDDRRLALRAAARVKQLKLGQLGVWNLEPYTALRAAHNLRAETWTARFIEAEASRQSGATVWSTVTPVVHDRHSKANDPAMYRREVAAMIANACAHVGLPEPRGVIVTAVSAFDGVPPAHADRAHAAVRTRPARRSLQAASSRVVSRRIATAHRTRLDSVPRGRRRLQL